MSIPLPDMLRELRARQHAERLSSVTSRAGLWAWAFLARRPRLYGAVTSTLVRALSALGRRRGRFRQLPLAGGWTGARDLPAPQGTTFQAAWRRRREDGAP